MVRLLVERVLDAVGREDWDQAASAMSIAFQAILEQQAQRHFNEHNYGRSLQCAQDLVRYFPDSAVGHLWEAKVRDYMLDLDRAVAAYKKALRLSPDDTALQGKLLAAKKKLIRKVDLVAYLPDDILLRIFELAPQERYVCTRVCKAWRQALLTIPHLWKALTVNLKQGTRENGAQFLQDCEAGLTAHLHPCLEDLRLTTDQDVCLLLSWLVKADCTKIKSLSIYDTHQDSQRSSEELSVFTAQWVDLLPKISTRLTHLSMTSVTYPLQLETFLSLLPKMQVFHYKLVQGSRSDYFVQWKLEPIEPQRGDLRFLSWPLCWRRFGREEAQYLADYCPRLQGVFIDSGGVSKLRCDIFISTLQRSCQTLKNLFVGPSHLTPSFNEKEETSTDGLRRVSFNRKEIHIHEDAIAGVLHNHQHTLEEVRYVGGNKTWMPFLSMPDSPIRFEKLHTLAVGHGRMRVENPLADILRGCPALQNVQLSYTSIKADTTIALALLPRLEMLTLFECTVQLGKLFRLLEAFAGKDQLKGLTFAPANYAMPMLGFLRRVGLIASLRYLRLLGKVCWPFQLGLAPGVVIRDPVVQGFLDAARESGLAQNLRMLRIHRSLIPTDIGFTIEDTFGHVMNNTLDEDEKEDIRVKFGDDFIKLTYVKPIKELTDLWAL